MLFFRFRHIWSAPYRIVAVQMQKRSILMRILTFEELKARKGIPHSKSTLRRLEAAGLFPKRVPISPGRHGWIEEELDDHQARLIELRDAGKSAPLPESLPRYQ
jgi:prophage regulatory protein